jgi:hypothetical protein
VVETSSTVGVAHSFNVKGDAHVAGGLVILWKVIDGLVCGLDYFLDPLACGAKRV